MIENDDKIENDQGLALGETAEDQQLKASFYITPAVFEEENAVKTAEREKSPQPRNYSNNMT